MSVTWSFHFNNNLCLIRNVFVTDYRAFLTNKPSSIAVETLSEVRALVFTKEAVNYLMEKSLKYEIWMRKLIEKTYVSMYKKIFSLLKMSATEKYYYLLNDEPHMMQMFSNYY